MGRPKKIKPAKTIVINEEANMKVRNEIVNGRYSLSLLEMRMVIALIGHISKNTDEFECGRIGVNELGDFMGLGEDNRYSKIRRIARELRKRELFFEWYSTPQSKKKSWLTTGWFDYIMYDNEHSTVEFQFASKIEPMLLKVQEAYVQLQCKPLMAFKCMYSNRFLMMFIEWEKIQPRTVAIEELRALLQTGDKYKYYKDFNQSVVQTALKEINALSDFNIRAVPQKTGRSYTHYKFFIKRKPKAELEAMETTATEISTISDEITGLTEEQNAFLNELCGYGIIKKTALTFVRTIPLDKIKANIKYVKEQDKQGNVRNFTRFMIAAVEKDFAGSAILQEEKQAESDYYKLTPKQRAAQENLRKQVQEIEEDLKKSQESSNTDDVENKKDGIKKELLELDEWEQGAFIDYLRGEVEKIDNIFKKRLYSVVLDKDYHSIIHEKNLLDLVINLIYGLRY